MSTLFHTTSVEIFNQNLIFCQNKLFCLRDFFQIIFMSQKNFDDKQFNTKEFLQKGLEFLIILLQSYLLILTFNIL